MADREDLKLLFINSPRYIDARRRDQVFVRTDGRFTQRATYT